MLILIRQGSTTDADTFYQSEFPSVTFSGVFRAKGNEAGMVYIINAQDCHSSARSLDTLRNRLFTAITRSKAWIRVLGIGRGMQAIVEEYERLKAREFELAFTYPTSDERKMMRILHRDMTTLELNRLRSRQQNLAKLVEDIEAERLHMEDLDKGTLDRLKELLNRLGLSRDAKCWRC